MTDPVMNEQVRRLLSRVEDQDRKIRHLEEVVKSLTQVLKSTKESLELFDKKLHF